MKIKDILKKKVIRALDAPLYSTIGYVIACTVLGKKLMIVEILPYYLTIMFIAWAVRYIWLRGESKIAEIEKRTQNDQNMED